MTIPYITIGCPTTGGGQVISGNSTFLVQGIPVACIGDKATCPKHTTVSTIVSGDPYMQVMGKSVARVNDTLSCGCKLLPKQGLVVGATGPSISNNANYFYDKQNTKTENNFKNEKNNFELDLVRVNTGKIFTPFGVDNSKSKKSNKKIEFTIKINKGLFETVGIYILVNGIEKKILEKRGSLSEGSFHKFDLDGFIDDKYDSTNFVNSNGIKFIIKGKAFNIIQDVVEKTIKFQYSNVPWIDTKIDRKSKVITHKVRIGFKDGGAKGLERPNFVPGYIKENLQQPVITTRTKSYEDLKKMALKGVNKYWGRNNSRKNAKSITLDNNTYEVYINATESISNATSPLELLFYTNGDSPRSSNWKLRRVCVYDVGYILYDSGWGYSYPNNADKYFEETFSHELGHEILKFAGDTHYSLTHKGSTTEFQTTIPGVDYPMTGEIDLMKYGENSRYDVPDFYGRVVASEKDVKSLIWVGGITVE